MIATETIFNAYINANIMLLFAFSLWGFTRFIITKFKIPLAYSLQLRLLNGVFLAIILSPLVVILITQLTHVGLLSQSFAMNISDFSIAQFLNGSIEMKASEFEKVLGLRSAFTENVLGMNSNIATISVAIVSIGFALLVARSLKNIFKLRSILRSCYEWRQFGNIKLLLSDTTFVPFSTRSFKTRYVVIPSGMLANNKDLKIVLAHEFQHMRQGDIEWEFIHEVLSPLFFWNPAFILWKRQVQKLRELACDQELVITKKLDIRTYCDCLLNVCRDSLRKNDRYTIALPTVPLVQVDRRIFGLNSEKFLKERIVAIVEPTTLPFSRKAFRFLLLPCMALVILAGLSLQKSGDWSQDRIMLSTIVNLERLDARNSLEP